MAVVYKMLFNVMWCCTAVLLSNTTIYHHHSERATCGNLCLNFCLLFLCHLLFLVFCAIARRLRRRRGNMPSSTAWSVRRSPAQRSQKRWRRSGGSFSCRCVRCVGLWEFKLSVSFLLVLPRNVSLTVVLIVQQL